MPWSQYFVILNRPLFSERFKTRHYRHYLSLCASIKDEAPYLHEWIEFHRMQGVDHFYIYDNNSTDHPENELTYYIRKRIVTFIPWPDHPYGQLSAYRHCVEQFKSESFWIGFIDLDEYIVPLATKEITDLLKNYEGKNGLGINWLIYGSSGKKRKPEGLTIEHYTSRAPADFLDNRHLKIIADPRKISAIENQHFFAYSDGSTVLDENQQLIPIGPMSEKTSVCKIRINHYFTRSEEEWKKKRLRGRTGGMIRPPEFFSSLDRNEVQDDVMQQYVQRLKKRVQRVKKLNETFRKVEAYLNSLKWLVARLCSSNTKQIEPPDFDWKNYVDNYQDLQDDGINSRDKAVRHWCEFGKQEGRTYLRSTASTTCKPIKSGNKTAKIS